MSNSDVPKNPAKKYEKDSMSPQDPFLPTEMEMPLSRDSTSPTKNNIPASMSQVPRESPQDPFFPTEREITISRFITSLSQASDFNAVEDTSVLISPNKKVRSGSSGCGGGNYPECQVDTCEKDLSLSTDYHRKYKVCEYHSEATRALVEDQIQRFCEYCHRFHLVSAFDGELRICIHGASEQRYRLSQQLYPSTREDKSRPTIASSPLALLPPSLSSSAPVEPTSITDLKIASVPAVSKSSRRVPPPCWSFEETVALIDAYRDKWHALNREKLMPNDWEEVAEAVATTCPDVTLKKTAVQCGYKMDKIRGKYRKEIQKARSVQGEGFISSWVHFNRMEDMEHGPETKRGDESGEEDTDDETYAPSPRYQFKNSGSSVARTTPRLFNRNSTAGSGGGGGSSIGEERSSGKRGREMIMKMEDDDPMMKIASAIKLLGETLLRTEQTKMEMTREIEAMRMEMEIKRTKMILESQQRLVEAFAKIMSDNTEENKEKTARAKEPEQTKPKN